MKLLSRLTPHYHLINNPLFDLEVRRIPWGFSERALWRFSARRLGAACGLTLPVCALLLRSQYDVDFVDGVVQLLFGLSLLAGLLLDCISIAVSVGSINGETTSGRWDLLRLTLLPVERIIFAKHGVAQVRVWRYTILLVALRLAVALAVLLLVVLSLRRDADPRSSPFEQTFSLIAPTMLLVGLAILYVLEPFWRARMVTALGVAVSARGRNGTSALLLAVAALGALWLVGLLVAAAVAIGAVLMLMQSTFPSGSPAQTLICSPLLVAVLVATVYGFYSVVQTWSLRAADRWSRQLLD